MNRYFPIIILNAVLSMGCWGQPTLERFALNNIEKGKWSKAKSQLMKAIRKDSLNADARYVFSVYYFTPTNPEFQIDSAYRYVMEAMYDFQASPVKLRERMRRFPLDSAIIVRQRERIDSAAFQRAKTFNTEQSYIDFLNRFPLAREQSLARELRDEVAFIDALKENTYQSFQNYLSKYPEASRASEAKNRYEKLLFEARTRDKKLSSYKQFLSDYPDSPYRREVELQVFEISTASGEEKAFENFLNQYPGSPFAGRAKALLYYLLKEREKVIPSFLLNDSLKKIRVLEQGYLVPIFKDGKYGFMNTDGSEIITPSLSGLDKDFLCGNITDDVLVSNDKVLTRNGTIIFRGEIGQVDDLGYGFLKVTSKGCVLVIHKSGFKIQSDCAQDAAVLGGKFIGIKKNDHWLLTTLNGRVLISQTDGFLSYDDVLAIKSKGKLKLAHFNEVAKVADQITPAYSRSYDEVKRWDEGLWVRDGELQGLLDLNLKEQIRFQKDEIIQEFFGAQVKSGTTNKLWSKESGLSASFLKTMIHKPWVVARHQGSWHLMDKTWKPIDELAFDSIMFIGPFFAGTYADSLRFYFNGDAHLETLNTTRLTFIPGKDSTYFVQMDDGSRKSIFNSTGQQLFVVEYDEVSYAGDNLFSVVHKGKRGLISSSGKIVVPVDYDAMGNVNRGMVQVLKEKKFGFMDIPNRREIKPVFDKNLVRYNHNFLIAFKDGFYGLIGWDNKPIIPFEYEEIRFWNDSSALLKRNFQWIIYNFIRKATEVDVIRDFKWIHEQDHENLMIVHQENHYGVISNRKGFVLPATYSDIVNLGSDSHPLYFTEKHVEEASIFVVIYYDQNGKLLRRQVFEEDDYERIYCSEN